MNGKVTIESVVDSHTQSSSKSTENFYKETAKQQGFEKETLNQTGVTGSSVYINGKNVAINAANVQAKDGTLQVGDATLATDDSGNLKLDDNGKPIVLAGSIDNLDLGTIELENREWDEKQKGYKGIFKGVMQVAGAVGGALGITDGITISKSQGRDTTSTSEEVTTLEGSNVVVGGNTVNAKGTQITATAEGAQAVVLGNNIDLGVARTTTKTNDYKQEEVIGGEGIKFTNDSLQLLMILRIM